MTATTLDQHTALIVVDLQEGSRSNPSAHPIDHIAAKAGELATAFRAAGLPVVLANYVGGPSGRSDMSRMRAESGAPQQMPPEGWERLLPELGAEDGDLLVSKSGWGTFHGTELADYLAERGVTQLVLAGIATSLGVESTAREARDRGFNVTLAGDAVTDMNPAAHEHSVATVFPLIAEVGTVAEVVALLDAR